MNLGIRNSSISMGKILLGFRVVQRFLILGLIRTFYPNHIRKELSKLLSNIAQDEYLLAIPSVNKTITKGFHAKDDTPEVREKFYKLIKNLILKLNFSLLVKMKKSSIKDIKGRKIFFMMK